MPITLKAYPVIVDEMPTAPHGIFGCVNSHRFRGHPPGALFVSGFYFTMKPTKRLLREAALLPTSVISEFGPPKTRTKFPCGVADFTSLFRGYRQVRTVPLSERKKREWRHAVLYP